VNALNPAAGTPDGARFLDDGTLVVTKLSFHEEKPVGILQLRVGSALLRQHTRSSALYAALFLVLGVAVAAGLAMVMRRGVSRPADELLQSAEAVAVEQDYTMRVPEHGQDEFGRLAVSFNKLLQAVEDREAALHRELKEGISRNAALKRSELEYRTLFQSAHDAIIVFEPSNEEVLQVNDRACEIYGLTREKFIGRTLVTFSRDPEVGRRRVEETLAAGATFSFQTVQYRGNGDEMILDINASVIDYRGRLAILSLNRDVTGRVSAEAALKRSEERYALAAMAANDGLWDWDLEKGGVFYSSRWAQIAGLDPSEISTEAGLWLDRIHPDDVEDVKLLLDAHQHGLTPFLSSEFRMMHKNGECRWVACRGLAVFEQGRAVRMAGSLSDVTDRRLAEEGLRYGALHDALTGLPNRSLFLNRLQHVLDKNQPERGRATTIAVLCASLGRFKSVNDRLGHEAGDELLRECGRRLSGLVRTGDTVARLTGDEFALLLEGLESPHDALVVARRALAILNHPFSVRGHEFRTPPRIGIAFGGGFSADTPAELMRGANLAAHAAKKRGTGVDFYDIRMQEEAATKLNLESELHAAVPGSQFFLDYQPVFSLPERDLAGFEALLRWRHPRRGVLAPAHFIDALEQTQLIVPATRWLLSEACRRIREWNDERGSANKLFVTVNVSPVHIVSGTLAEDVSQAIDGTRVDARWLGIEITESTFIESPDAARLQMNAIREAGARMIIDDFGTGYSSLAYLASLPFDKLKVDRSFVARLEKDRRGLGIVKAITTLAHDLDKEIIAEGVETEGQLLALEALRCQFAQGYLLSRPISEAGARSLASSDANLTRVERGSEHAEGAAAPRG
jgi:diguanylate cyclase (GGDEF)-like protein/PAS domain S-box-containing protein